jgi:hypothetical protein
MWAQVIRFREEPGTEAPVIEMIDQVIATARRDSGRLQEMALSDRRDPTSAGLAL